MREREKYIEHETGVSHLRESEFCCFYASEGTRTKIHKYVALRSPHLRKYISAARCCDSSSSDPQHVFLPDVPQRHLDAALRFLSTGYLVGSEDDYECLRRILLDDFGIGGVPATVTEGGNEDFEAVGDPGDDHECPLGCEESMPRSRLWPHVVRELDAFCSAAEPDVEHARNVKCSVCKININYKQGDDDAANMAIVREHYRDHHRRLKKHIFNTTGHKVDETVDEPDNSDDDNPHLPPVKRMRTADLPAKRPGPKSSKKNKRSETTSSETPGGVVVPKLRLNLAASLSKTSSPAVQVPQPAAAPSPTPSTAQTRSPTEEAALEPVRGGGIIRFKPSVVDQAKATMTTPPATTITIVNSVKEPTVPDKPNPVKVQLPPVPPLAPITPWADRQRLSRASGTNGAGGSGDKSNEKSRHSSAAEGRPKKRLKKKDRKRSRSRERLLDSDEEQENTEVNATERAAAASRRRDEGEELNQPPKKKRKAIPRKQCKECPDRVPFNETRKHAVTHCYEWWEKDGIERDPNTGLVPCNQSGCDSFYERPEDTISHLALFHKQLDHKMEERGKSINEFYEIYSASEISPACYKKGEMEDLTRVASNSVRSKKGAERHVENPTEAERNASENVETISSSSGSTAAVAPKNTNPATQAHQAENSDATSRFLDEVLSSDSSE